MKQGNFCAPTSQCMTTSILFGPAIKYMASYSIFHYVHTLNTHIKTTHSLAQWTKAHYCWQTFALEAAAFVYPLALSTEAQFGEG